VKAEIIRIGNSRGVRIPKPILEQCGLEGAVEMEVEGRRLVISAPAAPRAGWSEAFRGMSETGDDELLLGEEATTDWDKDEWRW